MSKPTSTAHSLLEFTPTEILVVGAFSPEAWARVPAELQRLLRRTTTVGSVETLGTQLNQPQFEVIVMAGPISGDFGEWQGARLVEFQPGKLLRAMFIHAPALCRNRVFYTEWAHGSAGRNPYVTRGWAEEALFTFGAAKTGRHVWVA